MNREPPGRVTDLVLEGPPPDTGRPSWLALIVAVVVALLVGSVLEESSDGHRHIATLRG